MKLPHIHPAQRADMQRQRDALDAPPIINDILARLLRGDTLTDVALADFTRAAKAASKSPLAMQQVGGYTLTRLIEYFDKLLADAVAKGH